MPPLYRMPRGKKLLSVLPIIASEGAAYTRFPTAAGGGGGAKR